MRKLFVMGALVCTLFLSGCSIVDEYFLPPPDDTVQEIFEAGNDAMREKNYSQAIVYYTRIKDEFPFSPYVIESELALADAHYLDEDYILAAEAYKDFETLHPRHEAIPYVLYQLGMSLKKSYNSIDHSATADLRQNQRVDCKNNCFGGVYIAAHSRRRIQVVLVIFSCTIEYRKGICRDLATTLFLEILDIPNLRHVFARLRTFRAGMFLINAVVVFVLMVESFFCLMTKCKS